MAEIKKLLVSLDRDVLEEMDALRAPLGQTRSEFIRAALRFHLAETRRTLLHSSMEAGYREMGAINLALSNAFTEADNESLIGYEEKLS